MRGNRTQKNFPENLEIILNINDFNEQKKFNVYIVFPPKLSVIVPQSARPFTPSWFIRLYQKLIRPLLP
jgi:hypothetical protein